MSRNSIFGVMLIFFMLQICFKHDSQSTILFRFGNDLYAQTTKYPYKKYGDRKEGLVKRRKLVSGEKLVLISASIENGENASNIKSPDEYKLGFYLDRSAQVDIEVNEYDHDYKMQPLQTQYAKGAHIFAWPANILNFYNLNLTELFPLGEVKSSSSGRQLIVPIVLFYENPKSREVNYRFCFIPNKSLSKVEYKIFNPKTGKLIFQDELGESPKGEVIYPRWNGKDDSGNLVKNGLLTLHIKATFKSISSSVSPKKLPLNYDFYHLANYANVWQ